MIQKQVSIVAIRNRDRYVSVLNFVKVRMLS